MDIVLASGSPRRRELLERVGLTGFSVLPADVDESFPPAVPPYEVVMALSRKKAAAVAQVRPAALVIAADTVVSQGGHILGKPHSAEEAAQMLRSLSGRHHAVYTGLTLQQGDRVVTQYEETTVSFRSLTDREIDAYIQTGEPMDKAGAYGIQGLGALFITSLQGDYYNVMGLPLCRLGLLLDAFGVPLLGGAGERRLP